MKIPEILQTEHAECGLACLAMVSSAHGHKTSLRELRNRFTISSKGATLADIIKFSSVLGLNARPLRLELHELCSVRPGAILHWRFNHFVVLEGRSKHSTTIIDPSIGRRTVTDAELSECFTGVALDIIPSTSFQPKRISERVSVKQLTGQVRGLYGALTKIFLVALVLEVFALTAPIFNQLIIDEVLSTGDRDLLNLIVIGFGLLLITQTAISVARSWMVLVLGQTVSLQWNANMFSHLLRLPLGYFARRHLGDISSRFGSLATIQKTATTSVVEALLDGIMTIAAVIAMFVYSWQLALITITAVALYAALRLGSYVPFKGAAAQRLVLSAQQNSLFLETLRAMAPIKLFGREDDRRIRWQNLQTEIQNRDLTSAKMSLLYSSANALLFGVENLLVFWFGSRLIMNTAGGQTGEIFTAGMLFAYVSYKTQFSQRISSMINYMIELRMLSIQSERLADIALTQPEVQGAAASGDTSSATSLAHLVPSLELRNVWFRYGDGEPWILKDVNLVVPAGCSLAIVGPSGAGKTTLIKVLLGLLTPTEGEVLFGGHPIRLLGISNFRKELGTVMQEDCLLSGSLYDNISFFDSNRDESRIVEAAQLARIKDEIERMPMGFQTTVGDLGSGLSGGQKQRVLLARALYKNPRILLLDEATSHLDIENERAIVNTLSQSRITRIFIAHRPDTIASAEMVYGIREGALTEVRRVSSLEVPSIAVV